MAPHDYRTDELMTVADIAAILKLNPQTIRNRIDDDKLPHLLIGERRVRVWRSDFQAFLHAAASPTPPAPPSRAIWEP